MITNTVMHASPNHGFPMFSNLDDFDTWPEDQAELYIDVVVAVVKAGFKGVKADTAESNSKSIIPRRTRGSERARASKIRVVAHVGTGGLGHYLSSVP